MPTLRLIVAVAVWLTPHLGSTASADSGRPIKVHAQRLSIGGADHVGRLQYRTVLHLTSDDDDFGGFSGLTIDRNQSLTAVSDQGHWLSARLELNPHGILIGLRAARMGRLCDDDGDPVAWERRDAEEIQVLPGRGFLVSFERHHRIVLYADGDTSDGATSDGAASDCATSGSATSDSSTFDGGHEAFDNVPRLFPFPPAIVSTRRNKGMEAVAYLPDGRLVTFAEDLRTVDDDIIGWIGHPETGDWRHLTLPTLEDFLPTGAALLPGGDTILLERSYTRAIGSRVRLVLLEAGGFVPGARLEPIELARIEPPATIDNMEAVAVSTGSAGETLIYLMSDNNYNNDQRTLLMQFELLDPIADSREVAGTPRPPGGR